VIRFWNPEVYDELEWVLDSIAWVLDARTESGAPPLPVGEVGKAR
jgi:very-short-patch-repair endonuclease